MRCRQCRGSSTGLVIPAKAGIHLLPISFIVSSHSEIDNVDSRFRGNDDGAHGFPFSRE